MFLKKIDFLSPPISLYYRLLPSHSSYVSGFLSILSIVLVIILLYSKLSSLFNRKNSTPNSTSFTYFVEDAGTIILNPSSLFHYISIEDLIENKEEFNFSYFNAIGFEKSLKDYATDKEIEKYDHWLYGYCNNKTDIKATENIISNKFFSKLACIRKYYDSKEGLYYDTNDQKFRFPSISHGTLNLNNKLYTIVIQDCKQSILDKVFNGKIKCKNISEYNMIMKVANLNFIDQYIDILNYSNPVSKYLVKIESLLEDINYSVNYLNINPSIIKSNFGYLFNKIKEDIYG